jgi:toxin-antitoxin system PIN domain toxin
MIAIDTNLLIYAHRRATSQHKAARKTIERAANDSRGWGISLQSVAEFWSVVTHPAAAGRPSSPAQAKSFLSNLRADAGMLVWTPGTGFDERLLQLALDLAVPGPRIFDLQIALTAFEHGAAEIWTHDSNFVKVPGLRLVHPLS